jgi:hypothetical protein
MFEFEFPTGTTAAVAWNEPVKVRVEEQDWRHQRQLCVANSVSGIIPIIPAGDYSANGGATAVFPGESRARECILAE